MKRPPTIPLGPADLTDDNVTRFQPKAQPVDDCLIWTAATNNCGYGVFRASGRQVYAHRFAWVLAHGVELPTDLTIDHLCQNRSCVRPEHLEAVSIGENTRRQPNAFHTRTHCPQNHPYAGDNLYRFPDGRRACRTCMRDAQRRYQQRKAATA